MRPPARPGIPSTNTFIMRAWSGAFFANEGNMGRIRREIRTVLYAALSGAMERGVAIGPRPGAAGKIPKLWAIAGRPASYPLLQGGCAGAVFIAKPEEVISVADNKWPAPGRPTLVN